MSKGTIKDPSISIRPSSKLNDFIKTLNDVELELPENVLSIYVALTGDSVDRKTTTVTAPISPLTPADQQLLASLSKDDKVNDNVRICLDKLALAVDSDDEDEITELNDAELKKLSKAEAKRHRTKLRDRTVSRLTLNLIDLKWLNVTLKIQRDAGISTEFLHELLEGSKLILPKNEIIERDPVLEARCQRLKREQEERRYHAMTKNVDTNRRHAPDDTIGYQLKQMNRELIGVAQFIFSVLAGFAFGFIGVELIVGDLDFGFRLLLGITCALVIAIAEIYFLAKKLNDDLDYAEKQEQFMRLNKLGVTSPPVEKVKSCNSKKEHDE